jgi:hypothetical protein
MARCEQTAFDQLGDGVFGKVARDVGLADDAHELVAVNDRQPPNLVVVHNVEHLINAGRGINVLGGTLSQLAGGDRDFTRSGHNFS